MPLFQHDDLRIGELASRAALSKFAGPAEDQMAVFPTRAVELAPERTAFTFTMFQAPDMPDELFESQYGSLRREFENIERVFKRGERE